MIGGGPFERRYLSPPERAAVWRRRGAVAGVGFVAVLVAWMVDGPLGRLIAVQDIPRLESRDWYQVARQVGYFPVWVLVAACVFLLDRDASRRAAMGPASPVDVWPPRPAHHRAGLVLLAASVPALLSELTKYLSGRSRPLSAGQSAELAALCEDAGGRTVAVGDTIWGGGVWADLGLTGGFPELTEGIGLGFFSGHTATAFGGAVMLGLLFPPVRLIAWGLAAACGISRIAAGAHTPSDVLAAALVAIAAATLLHATAQGPRREGQSPAYARSIM